MTTVAIETHGCKLNQADSQALAREFALAGCILVAPEAPADVYVLDSCTVTHVADRKARHALRAARRRNPAAFIVVTGCYPERAPSEMATLHGVDLAVGNRGKAALVQRVMALKSPVSSNNRPGLEETAPRVRASVKIQEGCDQVCAFCIVPQVRGRARSVPPDGLVAQVQALEEEGFQEVVLTGTQLGSYSSELPGAGLRGLLERLLAETRVPRIRVSSLQPQTMDEALLRLWENPRLCRHFHMPLQSGSDAVLRRMRRRYTAAGFAAAVEMARALVPGAAITTDVIGGFPGESEEEFQESFDLCDTLSFWDLHVFPYSERPGTSASHFGGRLEPREKGRRVKQLLDLGQRHTQEHRRRLVGQTEEVLWEGGSWRDGVWRWAGLTDTYARVVTQDAGHLANTITRTLLVEQNEGLLYGEVGR